MEYIIQQHPYRQDTDILIRVYENQQENHDEKSQCVGEILFRPHLQIEHIRFTAWLPYGLVEAIIEQLNYMQGKDYTVQIANELPYKIGVLTSCYENFDVRLRSELSKMELLQNHKRKG